MHLPSPQQLRYVVALADHGHFGRAAAACAVTQSTLSAGVIALERQFGASLLDRSNSKRVVFTPLGLDVVARGRAALTALEAVAETIAASRDPLSGPLRLGVIPTVGPFLLPRLMPALRDALPRLRLWLREDTTERLRAQLLAGRLDLLLLALPCECDGLEVEPVFADPFLLALPPEHRLCAQPGVAASALTGEPMLLLEEGHCLRAQAQEACGLPRSLASGEEFAATSLHTLVQMVAGGLGLTLLPRLAVEGGVLGGADVELRPLFGEPGEAPSRTLALAWRPRSPRAAEFRALLPVIRAGLEGPAPCPAEEPVSASTVLA
nr:hydrogen peroxide-inducible genes activator [Sabulicella rubraurantiaca]